MCVVFCVARFFLTLLMVLFNSKYQAPNFLGDLLKKFPIISYWNFFFLHNFLKCFFCICSLGESCELLTVNLLLFLYVLICVRWWWWWRRHFLNKKNLLKNEFIIIMSIASWLIITSSYDNENHIVGHQASNCTRDQIWYFIFFYWDLMSEIKGSP